MIKMFSSYVRSRLEYCSLVWNPWKKEEIDKIERVQKNFTSKIEGMEKLNYHQRLKRLRMYSMERRRERYLIINAWQEIENVKENILKLETGNNGDPVERTLGRRRCLNVSVLTPVTVCNLYGKALNSLSICLAVELCIIVLLPLLSVVGIV